MNQALRMSEVEEKSGMSQALRMSAVAEQPRVSQALRTSEPLRTSYQQLVGGPVVPMLKKEKQIQVEALGVLPTISPLMELTQPWSALSAYAHTLTQSLSTVCEVATQRKEEQADCGVQLWGHWFQIGYQGLD